MADFIERFGNYVDRQVPEHPAYAAWLLLNSYRVFGLKLKHMPEKRLPPSKQYLATVAMESMVKPLAHPDRQILTSIMTPCELFQAMDLYPMCAEQFSTYAGGAKAEHGLIEAAENAGIAETFCSYHKAVTGAVLSGVMKKPLAIVNTSLACDANNLTFRAAAKAMGAPQFYIDVPYQPDEAAVLYVAEQLKELAVFLEEATGKKLDTDRLSEHVNNSAETIRILQEILPMRREKFVSSELTAELYEVLMVHNALGQKQTLEYARRLREDYLCAPEGKGLRLLWMHSNPYHQKAVKDIFNYSEEYRICLTEMCYDPVVEMDLSDPWKAMASRLVFNSYNGPVDRRIQKARRMAETIQAHGIILFCHWGCKETCGASAVIRDTLEKEGFPVLILNGDGVDRRNSSDGQVVTRIQAFLEMLEKQT